MHVTPSFSDTSAFSAPPAASAPAAPSAWALRGGLSFLLTLRIVGVGAVAYGVAAGSVASSRWLVGGTSLNALMMASNMALLIGGSSLIAITAVLARWSIGRTAAMTSGYITLAWLAMQVFLGGARSWQLPFALAGTVLSLLMAAGLEGKEEA